MTDSSSAGTGNDTPRTKSPKAFRTISEAAKELGLPQHVLRFWETKFSQIKPMKRAGGRRFYRPEDVELLTRIKTLLHSEGYTIKGVQKLLRQNGSIAQGSQRQEPQEQEIEQAVSLSENDGEPTVSNDRQRLIEAEINFAIGELESIRADLLSVRKNT